MALFQRGLKRGDGKIFFESMGVLRPSGQQVAPRKRAFDQLDLPKSEVLDLRSEEEIREKPVRHFIEKPKRNGQVFYSQAMALPIAISGGVPEPATELRQVRGFAVARDDERVASPAPRSDSGRNQLIVSAIGVAVAALLLVSLAVFAYFNVSVPSLPEMHLIGF